MDFKRWPCHVITNNQRNFVNYMQNALVNMHCIWLFRVQYNSRWLTWKWEPCITIVLYNDMMCVTSNCIPLAHATSLTSLQSIYWIIYIVIDVTIASVWMSKNLGCKLGAISSLSMCIFCPIKHSTSLLFVFPRLHVASCLTLCCGASSWLFFSQIVTSTSPTVILVVSTGKNR